MPFIPVHSLARDDSFSLRNPRCLLVKESVSIGFGMGEVMNVIFGSWCHPDRMENAVGENILDAPGGEINIEKKVKNERAGQNTDLVARQRLTTTQSESHLLNAPAAVTVLRLIVLNSSALKEFSSPRGEGSRCRRRCSRSTCPACPCPFCRCCTASRRRTAGPPI